MVELYCDNFAFTWLCWRNFLRICWLVFARYWQSVCWLVCSGNFFMCWRNKKTLTVNIMQDVQSDDSTELLDILVEQ